ncbi:polysaccharide biosynthesis tyrosine autokinase [Georgenia faecalis]|uniref:polysaccharide biosynthesis tyrosine autokinase n=1 Tax=Georgenia faecalis TaxID=2483799 RepID=UPI000FDC7B96|nr:polysaccharide biosynthesis tyrosine autokinase [Georgenia faecalis]
MDFAHILNVPVKRWRSLLVSLLVTLTIVGGATAAMPELYSASTRIFFSVQAGETVSELAQGSSFTEQQMSSYAEVARSPLVLDAVVSDHALGVSARELAVSTVVRQPAGTAILEVSVTNRSPEDAAALANAVGGELARVVSTLIPARTDGSESVRATTLAPATPPTEPASPDVARNLTLGVVLGLLLGLGVAALREALDTKVRSEADLASVSNAAVIGSIRFDDATSADPVVMHDDPHGPRAEAYRRLRTNLQFLDLADRPSSVVVTSSLPEEGKSTTAANLAVALADAGSRVVLVDADLRRPSVADYVGIEGRVGLTTVLIGRAEIEDVVQPWKNSTLDILPAGQVPPNPSELLGSRAMANVLKQLTDRYDVVIIDSPPLLPVTDAAVLSNQVGGMLVVVGADRVHKGQVRDALESLAAVDAHVLGLVMNKVSKQDNDRYGYSYESYRPREGTGGGSKARRGITKAPRRTPVSAGQRG